MTRGKNSQIRCRDGKENCEDYGTDFDYIKTVHFTLCQKPWIYSVRSIGHTNCKKFHSAWFRIWKGFDENNDIDTSAEGNGLLNEIFHG